MHNQRKIVPLNIHTLYLILRGFLRQVWFVHYNV